MKKIFLLLILISSVFHLIAGTSLNPRIFHKELRIFDIAVSDDESVWFFGTEKGISEYRDGKLHMSYTKSEKHSSNNGLQSETVPDLLLQGNILYGSTFSLSGKSCIFKLDNGNLTVWHEKTGSPRNVNSMIMLTDEVLLCSSFNEGLFIFDTVTGSSIPFLPDKFRGKFLLDCASFRNIVYVPSKYEGVFSFASPQILRTGDSLEIIDMQGISVAEITEHSARIHSNNTTCAQSSADGIWFGTQGGASFFQPTGKNLNDGWKNYWDLLINNFVSTIFVDGDHVWIGTPGGLSLFSRKKEKWNCFTDADGLTSNTVLKIVCSRKFIWVGTEQGVLQIDKDIYSRLK